MWEQPWSEIEVVDDLNQDDPTVEIEDESTPDSEDDSKKGEEDDTPSTKTKKTSNKSNFKKLSKQNKELKARLAKYESSDDPEDEDDEEPSEEAASHDEVKFTRFLLKNPEAVDYEEDIIATLDRFAGISFEEAFSYVKMNNSTSTTHKDFSTKTKTVPKKLSQLTTEEALKHYEWDDAWFLNWKRKTGKLKD